MSGKKTLEGVTCVLVKVPIEVKSALRAKRPTLEGKPKLHDMIVDCIKKAVKLPQLHTKVYAEWECDDVNGEPLYIPENIHHAIIQIQTRIGAIRKAEVIAQLIQIGFDN